MRHIVLGEARLGRVCRRCVERFADNPTRAEGIGPIKDLNQLNRVRQQLQSAEIVTLVIRVED